MLNRVVDVCDMRLIEEFRWGRRFIVLGDGVCGG